mmetsp:Transcript_36123/g.113455  ORF Transcript_36123/g.113455 Transcript_36123/m.113455 type:complete len:231 (+) Transcript_36123:649-1341(+)
MRIHDALGQLVPAVGDVRDPVARVAGVHEAEVRSGVRLRHERGAVAVDVRQDRQGRVGPREHRGVVDLVDGHEPLQGAAVVGEVAAVEATERDGVVVLDPREELVKSGVRDFQGAHLLRGGKRRRGCREERRGLGRGRDAQRLLGEEELRGVTALRALRVGDLRGVLPVVEVLGEDVVIEDGDVLIGRRVLSASRAEVDAAVVEGVAVVVAEAEAVGLEARLRWRGKKAT